MKKIFFSILMTLFMPLSAFALTSTFQIHGSQCEENGNVTTRDQWGVSVGAPYPWGLRTAGLFTLRCPVIINATFRPTSAWLVVRAYDRHPDADVACTLSATDSAGSLLGSATGQTSATGAGVKIFQVGVITLGQPLVSKYFYLTCSLPQSYDGARSYLTSIDINVSN